MARSGCRMASRMLPSPRTARYSGSERPAWRMNHTGVCVVGRLRQAARKAASAGAVIGAHARGRRGRSTDGRGAADPRETGPEVAEQCRKRAARVTHDPQGARRHDRPTQHEAQRSLERPGMTQHPDLIQEQAYVDRGDECLERTRQDAWKLRDLTEAGLGGTFQARYEREVFDEALVNRPDPARSGAGGAGLRPHRSGRRGRHSRPSRRRGTAVESYHIGRLAVADEEREPVVVDWRAPVAEPFYRRPGATHGPGPSAALRHQGPPDPRHRGRAVRRGPPRRDGRGRPVGLLDPAGRLETRRTGQLGDIVGTIQAQQDEIIRSPAAGRPRGPGRAGHRQDGGGAAPGRLPALRCAPTNSSIASPRYPVASRNRSNPCAA